MPNIIYNVFKKNLADAAENLPTGDYRMLLLSGTVTADADHATVGALLAANTEVSHASYGRVALTNVTVTQDDTNNWALIDGDDADFGSLDEVTPTAGVIYRHVTNDSDSIPVALGEDNFGGAANGAGYVVNFTNGIFRIT